MMIVGSRHPRRRGRQYRVLWAFLWVPAVLLVAIRLFVAELVVVRGSTMAPNALEGDVLLVSRTSVLVPGEVVVVDGADGQAVLGRVVAGPGQSIRAERGLLALDGVVSSVVGAGTFIFQRSKGTRTPTRRQRSLIERWPERNGYAVLGDHVGSDGRWGFEMTQTVVPAGHVFVLCDNRPLCTDAGGQVRVSPISGIVPLDWISGVATHLVWYGSARSQSSDTRRFNGAFVPLAGAGEASAGTARK